MGFNLKQAFNSLSELSRVIQSSINEISSNGSLRPNQNTEITKESLTLDIENGTPTEKNKFKYSATTVKEVDGNENIKIKYNYNLNNEIPPDNLITNINAELEPNNDAAYYRKQDKKTENIINVCNDEMTNGTSTEVNCFVYNEGIQDTKIYKTPNPENLADDYVLIDGSKKSFFDVNAMQYNGTKDIVTIRNL